MSVRPSSPDDLADALGPSATAGGVERFTVDGITPSVVVRPDGYAGVSAALSFANTNGLAVIPMGGGCHAEAANLPQRYDIALDLGALAQVVEFEPADLTITVQAGMTLGELRRLSTSHGRLIPFDDQAPDTATVGGLIAGAVMGPASASLGSPRDFTIGLRVVMADGRMTRAGGKVVKNVAGYDLCKLYTGSAGTLGVIVEASLRALPAAPVEQRLEFVSQNVVSACADVRTWFRAGLCLRSASMHKCADGWLCRITLAGTRAGVDRTYREIAAKAALRGTESGADAPAVRHSTEIRFTTLPSRLALLAGEVSERLPGADIELWPASGVAVLRTGDGEGTLEAARSIAAAGIAGFAVRACPPELKQGLDVFGVSPDAIDLHRRIKSEFDPLGTLSPGRGPGLI